VSSPFNASGYFTIYGEESLHLDHFEARLSVGDTNTTYARTGYLGFIRRTDLTQSDGGLFSSALPCVFFYDLLPLQNAMMLFLWLAPWTRLSC
jgi:hypothetical protein